MKSSLQRRTIPATTRSRTASQLVARECIGEISKMFSPGSKALLRRAAPTLRFDSPATVLCTHLTLSMTWSTLFSRPMWTTHRTVSHTAGQMDWLSRCLHGYRWLAPHAKLRPVPTASMSHHCSGATLESDDSITYIPPDPRRPTRAGQLT